MIDIIIKTPEQEYGVSDINRLYTIAEIAKQIKTIEDSTRDQIENLLKQINDLEPDPAKQLKAIEIAAAVREQLPLLINI